MTDAREKPSEPVAGLVAAPARERTIDISASDADVILESNPPPTQTGLTLDARTVAANEPTDPGVLQQRLKRRKSIVLAAASGVGVVALGLTVRGFVHRTSELASRPPVFATVPAASLPQSPEGPHYAPDAVAATADSVTPPSSTQAPPASATPKSPTPGARPSRTKRAPSKVPR